MFYVLIPRVLVDYSATLVKARRLHAGFDGARISEGLEHLLAGVLAKGLVVRATLGAAGDAATLFACVLGAQVLRHLVDLVALIAELTAAVRVVRVGMSVVFSKGVLL